jgi:hypothetical protein
MGKYLRSTTPSLYVTYVTYRVGDSFATGFFHNPLLVNSTMLYSGTIERNFFNRQRREVCVFASTGNPQVGMSSNTAGFRMKASFYQHSAYIYQTIILHPAYTENFRISWMQSDHRYNFQGACHPYRTCQSDIN